MREYNFIIRDEFQNGLAPDNAPSRNAGFMTTMENLIPGAPSRVPDTPVFPVTGVELSGIWPWPQLMRGERATVLREAYSLYLIDNNWAATKLDSVYSNDLTIRDANWDACVNIDMKLVEFGDCWFVSNGGAGLWFYLPYILEDKVIRYSLGDYYATPRVGGVAKHHDRLFFAGPQLFQEYYRPWFTSSQFNRLAQLWRDTAPDVAFVDKTTKPFQDNGWVVWSEINGGSDDMPFYVFLAMLNAFGFAAYNKVEDLVHDAIEDKRIGMVQLPTKSIALRLETLGSNLLAYTQDGVYALRLDDSGYYAPTPLSKDVLAAPGSLCASAAEHVYVSTKGFIHRVTPNNATVLDHRSRLLSMNQAQMRIVRDPIFDVYYICDGVTCYVLANGSLGGPMDVKPTFLDDYNGELIGYLHGSKKPGQVSIVTGAFDINERGLKHVNMLQIGYSGLKDCRAAVDYCYDSSGTYSRSPWIPVHPAGSAFTSASFVDGRVAFKGDIVNGAEAEIERVEVRYNNEDLRFRRGTKGVPGTRGEPLFED